jgi:hypothetical protein
MGCDGKTHARFPALNLVVMFNRELMKRIILLITLLCFPALAYVDTGEKISFYKLISSPKHFNTKRIHIFGVVAAVKYHSGDGPLLRKVYLFPNSDSAAHFALHEAVEIKYANDDLFLYVEKSLNMLMVEVIGDYTYVSDRQGMGTIKNFIKLSPIQKNKFGQDNIGDMSEPATDSKLW